MNNFIKPFALVMALTIPAIASADITANNVTVGEVRITYTTADAPSSYGRKELESQIRRAAQKVCGAPKFQRARPVRQLMEHPSYYDKPVADEENETSSTSEQRWRE